MKNSFYIGGEDAMNGVGFNLAVNLFIIKYIYSHFKNKSCSFDGIDVYKCLDGMASNQLYKIFGGKESYIWTEERIRSICDEFGIESEYMIPDKGKNYGNEEARGKYIELKGLRNGVKDWELFFCKRYRYANYLSEDIKGKVKTAITRKEDNFFMRVGQAADNIDTYNKYINGKANETNASNRDKDANSTIVNRIKIIDETEKAIIKELDFICSSTVESMHARYGKDSPIFKFCYYLQGKEAYDTNKRLIELVKELNNCTAIDWVTFKDVTDLDEIEKVFNKQLSNVKTARVCNEYGYKLIRE